MIWIFKGIPYKTMDVITDFAIFFDISLNKLWNK